MVPFVFVFVFVVAFVFVVVVVVVVVAVAVAVAVVFVFVDSWFGLTCNHKGINRAVINIIQESTATQPTKICGYIVFLNASS